MNKGFQLYVFDISGTTEIISRIEPIVNDQAPIADDQYTVVQMLNKKAPNIAEKIEKEIGRFFRSSATVQADIRFYEGSIVLEGTILIMMNWLGPIALEAGKKAFEEEFSRVVGVATQRVLQQIFREITGWVIAPIRKIDVTTQDIQSTQSTPAAPVKESATTSPAQSPAEQLLALQPTRLSRYLPFLTLVNTLILILLLISQATNSLP